MICIGALFLVAALLTVLCLVMAFVAYAIGLAVAAAVLVAQVVMASPGMLQSGVSRMVSGHLACDQERDEYELPPPFPAAVDYGRDYMWFVAM